MPFVIKPGMTPDEIEQVRAKRRANARRWEENNPEKSRANKAAWAKKAYAEKRPSVVRAQAKYQEKLRTPEQQILRREKRSITENKQKVREYAKQYRLRPEAQQKDRARFAVRSAIEQGALVRPEICERCGGQPPRGKDGRSLIRADHWKGYAPEHYLDVRWLCTTCDGKIQRERNKNPQEHKVLTWTVGQLLEHLRQFPPDTPIVQLDRYNSSIRGLPIASVLPTENIKYPCRIDNIGKGVVPIGILSR